MRTRYPDSAAISPDGAAKRGAAGSRAGEAAEARTQAEPPDKAAANAPAQARCRRAAAAAGRAGRAPRKPDPAPTGSISRR